MAIFCRLFKWSQASPTRQRVCWKLHSSGKPKSYHFGDFYLPAEAGNGDVQGKIVFAGTGISSPAQHQDDYAGLDVKGKIVLIVPGMPSGIDMSRLE